MLYEATVTYEGIEFTVEYAWEDAYKGSRFEPAHDDGIDEYFIYLGKVDVTEMLTQYAQDEIIQLADNYHRDRL